MTKQCLILGLMLCALSVSACGEETGSGQIAVTIYGEGFIEEGIPADEVADGWSVQFTRFVVTVPEVSIAGAQLTSTTPIDLVKATNGAGQEMGQLSVDAGSHSGASLTVGRIEISGTATKDTTTKTFSWVFDRSTHYTNCDVLTVVADGQKATFQITIHADHLLYDSLVSEEPQILFGPIAAADANGDNDITQAELEAAGIGAYDPGNQDISNMWAWLIAQSRTLGHVNGERHCEAHE